MKPNTIIIFIIVISSIIVGCKDDTSTQPYIPKELPFRLLLQKGFQSDSVVFKIGDRAEDKWYSTTTSVFDSSAGQLQTSFLEGTYKFSFTVLTHNVTAETTFVLKNDVLFLGVEYLRSDRKLKFTLTNQQFPNWSN